MLFISFYILCVYSFNIHLYMENININTVPISKLFAEKYGMYFF